MKIKNTPYFIGKKVKFSKAYPMSCGERFPDKFSEDGFTKIGREENPIEVKRNSDGFVISLKRVIMAGFKFKPEKKSQGFEDLYPEYERAKSTGKYEWCLVVVPSLTKFKPLLVREEDIIV